MSVLLDTSAGELVVDLFVSECPFSCENFLKLCKIKYYNGCLFYNVQPNYIAQTGDPTGTGKGGNSIFGIIRDDPNLGFVDEIVKSRKINRVGLVCMANEKENANKSQFFITLRGEDLQHLEGKHTVFGEVAEGLDVLEKLNSLYCDEDGRPYQDVRIRHTYILDDPYPDPFLLSVPPDSPTSPIPANEIVKPRIPYEESLENDENLGKTEEEVEESIKRKEAYSRALVLEMTGDIPDVDVKPPKEVLFVCKLNPVTTDADLELIFSRFGTIHECEIIRDSKTGDSLNYAFIEFDTEEACIEAYEKMNNALIDDRRIKVDFSQSVSKLWNKYLLRPRKDIKKDNLHQGIQHNTKQIANVNSTKPSNSKWNTDTYYHKRLPSSSDLSSPSPSTKATSNEKYEPKHHHHHNHHQHSEDNRRYRESELSYRSDKQGKQVDDRNLHFKRERESDHSYERRLSKEFSSDIRYREERGNKDIKRFRNSE